MKKGILFSVPMFAVFLVALLLGRFTWGDEIIRLAIAFWCFIAGAIWLGRVMNGYWTWCTNYCQAGYSASAKSRRKQRGVHRLAATLSQSRGAK